MDSLQLYKLQKICRVCLKDDILISIYSPTFIIRPIDMLTKLHISKIPMDENLPTLICQSCLYRLLDAYNLQQLAEASEQRLLQYLNKNFKPFGNSMCFNSNSLNDITSNCQATIQVEVPKMTESTSSNLYDNICDIFESSVTPSNMIEVVRNDEMDLLNDVEIDVSSLTRSEADNDNDNCTLNNVFNSTNSKGDNHVQFACLSANEVTNTNNIEPHSYTRSQANNREQNSIIDKQIIKLSKRKSYKQSLKTSEECPECGKVFSYRGYLKIHKRLHTGERPYKCGLCSRQFVQLSKLRLHQVTHQSAYAANSSSTNRRYQCEKCSAFFTTSSNLKAHSLIHIEQRNFQCILCQQKFKSQRDLKRHEPVHKAIKDILCSYCDKSFAKLSYLNNHINTVHQGIRRHKCNDCNKMFSSRSNLICHIRIHTGEKPFQCPICPWKFKQSSALGRHLRKHTKSDNHRRNEIQHLSQMSI